MANDEHLSILKQGIAAWNRWRKANPDLYPNLRGADLRRVRLGRGNFRDTDLRDANLSETSLVGAHLSWANLTGANLSKANLKGAYLTEARLTLTNLSEADLCLSNLSSARIMASDLSHANLNSANLYAASLNRVTLNGANLHSANLTRAQIVRSDLSHAILTRCAVYGIALSNVTLEGAIQNELLITPEGEPAITVDQLEFAQLLHLLLTHRQSSAAFYAVSARGVLLLGYSEESAGMEILQALANALREKEYIPIVFQVGREPGHAERETIQRLASLSRFIIADLSEAAIFQELDALIPYLKVPYIPILKASRKTLAQISNLPGHPWIIGPPLIFANIEELLHLLPADIISPAEKKFQIRQHLLNELFPERAPSSSESSKESHDRRFPNEQDYLSSLEKSNGNILEDGLDSFSS